VENGGVGPGTPNGDSAENILGGISQDFLENTIGGGAAPYIWDFDTVWEWDEELGLPVLR